MTCHAILSHQYEMGDDRRGQRIESLPFPEILFDSYEIGFNKDLFGLLEDMTLFAVADFGEPHGLFVRRWR